jgi:hypothetical protein
MTSGQIPWMIWTLQHPLDFGVLAAARSLKFHTNPLQSLALAQLLHMVSELLTN